MNERLEDWFVDLIKSIYDNRDTGKPVVFTEDDDKTAKRVYEKLKSRS